MSSALRQIGPVVRYLNASFAARVISRFTEVETRYWELSTVGNKSYFSYSGSVLNQPPVGLCPKTPQKKEGIRMDPPTSEPSPACAFKGVLEIEPHQ